MQMNMKNRNRNDNRNGNRSGDGNENRGCRTAVVEQAVWGSAKLGTDAGRETAHAGTHGWMGAQGAHRVARTRGGRDLARCHAMPCHAMPCMCVCVRDAGRADERAQVRGRARGQRRGFEQGQGGCSMPTAASLMNGRVPASAGCKRGGGLIWCDRATGGRGRWDL